MKVLVINTGSSSIKYKLFHLENRSLLAAGTLEKIGEEGSRLKHENLAGGGEKSSIEQKIDNHEQGLRLIVTVLTDAEKGVVADTSEIVAVGHRVVHGGETFHKSTLIDAAVISAIRENIPLAPLHNPANLTGIEVANTVFEGTPQVAVFDTAFHQSIPGFAFRYALPEDLYKKYHIRRYGFHGTSHQYVARQAAQYLGQPLSLSNFITLHLGNGASVTAIRNGRSVDTSMGMTPLEGLIMGTRSGDLDPAIAYYLATHAQMSIDEIDNAMNKESGLKGICGVNDMREIEERMATGDESATLAMEMYCYRIKKYIGSYCAALGRVDALIFTAGIGENSSLVREKSCAELQNLGILIDDVRNRERQSGIREVHKGNSPVQILVVPTNEELEIAEQTMQVLEQMKV